MAQCQADQRLLPATYRSIDAALAELRFLNNHVGNSEQRRSHLESFRRVRQAAIEILIHLKEYGRALDYAERFDDQIQRIPQMVPRADSLSSSVAAGAPDTAIVKYAILPDQLVIWVITGGRASTLVSKVSSRSLQTSLRSMSDACASRDSRACDEASARLDLELISPVRAILPRNIIVVPDDFLATVPFAALKNGSTGRYLIEDHTILFSRCVSCVDWQDLRERQFDRAIPMIAFGNPAPLTRPLPDLPYASDEARMAVRMYNRGQLLVGSQATKARFLSGCRAAEIIHFAGHAVPNLELPDESALLFASKDADDGILAASEIAAQDLHHVRLVVLSACSTNVGRVSFGGPLSIADAFLRAGAKTVVATLRSTDDASARSFLKRFHESLTGGSTVAEALRDAQIAALRSGENLHRPSLDWAAYQTIM
jgi:CHAT domain-containing protein